MLHLSDEGEEAIDNFVQEAVQDFTLATRAGEDLIRQVVQRYLTDAARPLGPVTIVERELFAPLLAEVRTWICFVPLVNMQVSTRFSVGPAEYVPKETARRYTERFLRRTGAKQNMRYFAETALKGIEESEVSACLQLTFEAHPDAVTMAALHWASNGINLIRAFTSMFYRHGDRAYFGTPSEVTGGLWSSLAFGNALNPSVVMLRQHRHVHRPFVLSREMVSELRAVGFGKLLRMAALPKTQGATATAVWKCLQVVGSSVTHQSHHRGLSDCVFALDHLLSAESSSSAKIAERFAQLLGNNKRERIDYDIRCRRLYHLRSEIVHAGRTDVGEEDRREAESFAVSAAMKMLKMSTRFSKRLELCNHLTGLRFGR